MVLRLAAEHIGQVLELAKTCKLSEWSYADYFEEINKTENFGFVNVENNETGLLSAGEINGFIISRLIKLETLHIYNNGAGHQIKDKKSIYPNECEILNIGVLPATQGKGIGQKLLDATLAECALHNVAAVWLDVRMNNVNALGFYRRNNFEVVYTRKNYYQNPVEDAYVMKADLINPH
jgi:ribosomal protein S18 acetylase RimI-like enzyme